MLNVGRLPVWDDKNIPEKDDGDDYLTLGMCLMPLSCGFKKLVKVVSFMLCIFCLHLKKTCMRGIKKGHLNYYVK